MFRPVGNFISQWKRSCQSCSNLLNRPNNIKQFSQFFRSLVTMSTSRSFIMRNQSFIPKQQQQTRLFSGFKNPKASKSFKTRKAAAKRIKRTASGHLKFSHGGKSHLNGTKSRTRLRRLNKKGILTGVWSKKMSRLIVTSK